MGGMLGLATTLAWLRTRISTTGFLFLFPYVISNTPSPDVILNYLPKLLKSFQKDRVDPSFVNKRV
jgi:hypothetical protein